MNPYRQQARRKTDYVFVVASIIAGIAIVIWAFFG